MKTITLTAFLVLIAGSIALKPDLSNNIRARSSISTSSTSQKVLSSSLSGDEEMTDSEMTMDGGLTFAQAGGNVTAAEESGVSGNQTIIDANMTINGLNIFVIAEVTMGFEHPRAWHVEHCRHVPYFTMPDEILGCVQSTGWFYNMSSRRCDMVQVPCNDLPTLNFWSTIAPCLANCTNNGTGIVFADAPMVNLDPRAICILPALTGVSSPKCAKTAGSSSTSNEVIKWTYDATVAACFEVQYDCHWQASNNSFAYNSTCQHFCHDISFPNMTSGHHLFLNGTTTNQTINGVSINVQETIHVGWINLTVPWNPNHCRKIPYFNTTKEKSGCVNSTGFYYNVTTRSCSAVSVPCGDLVTQNFFPDQTSCINNCSDSSTGKGFAFAGAPKQNFDPREVCSMPAYTNDTGNCTGLVESVEDVWTYDPVSLSCLLTTIVCDHSLTLNAFALNSSCTTFCAGVSASNDTFGYHLLPNTKVTPIDSTLQVNTTVTVGA